MTSVFKLKKEFVNIFKSVSHINWTSRPQFVKKNNSLLFSILNKIKEKKWYWVIINTSFNIHGKTIVRTPSDAINDFLECNLDVLYIEWYKVTKI
jgi:carbamoyltransferase